MLIISKILHKNRNIIVLFLVLYLLRLISSHSRFIMNPSIVQQADRPSPWRGRSFLAYQPESVCTK